MVILLSKQTDRLQTERIILRCVCVCRLPPSPAAVARAAAPALPLELPVYTTFTTKGGCDKVAAGSWGQPQPRR